MDREADIQLLDIQEVAALLKISTPTFRRLQQKRQIPFYKVGGRIRFSRSDIAEYLKRKRVAAIS